MTLSIESVVLCIETLVFFTVCLIYFGFISSEQIFECLQSVLTVFSQLLVLCTITACYKCFIVAVF